MMGKRVNFAARSVITPDPNLDIGEVGIPEVFAKKLTYPVPVTPWNVEYLRTLISNGPDVYPGAVAVEMEDGLQRRINPGNQAQQESLLKVLLTPHSQGKRGFQGVKVVHRHLQNGDILLLNRQPTLHKPSIMAHRARILKGEKTLRMHYANCKAYNADFDGDEMNAHLPQDEVARSEGYNIAEVAQQYLVPKDGTPLSGLIQDHMIAGVRLSLRGSFFNKADYEQLVFQALSHKVDRIKTLPPYIIKPIPLWSGKQVLSTVIINVIPKDQEPINLNATSKIPAKAWKTSKPREWVCGGTPFKDERTMSEAEVVIRHGELLSGILDKTHYGATAYGLVHCMYELYGGSCALQLLSSFTKVFTRFLQQDGFTLGVRDILTTQSADRKRKKCILNLRQIGQSVMASALGLPEDTPVDDLVSARDAMIANDSKFQQVIDRQYKMALDQYTNQINNVCLPAGLVTKFPQNNLQLMVQSGAKGSTVNTMQISCLLGQIELEGKRPPVMISGTSMPSFPATEFAPRSGGFIDARFMTGLQPQEFFFHCMAGREGLIDTAVKTSRSGYLQRCLIKHLEGLRVGYDLTVRNSDQSVIQFLYGEDGMDISKAQFLNKNQLPFLKDNAKSIVKKDVVKNLKREIAGQEIDSHREKIRDWLRDKGGDAFKRKRISPFSLFVEDLYEKSEHKMKLPNSELYKTWQAFKPYLKQRLSEACKSCPDPVTSLYQPDHYFGSLNEHVERLGYEFSKNESKKVRKQFDVMLKVKSMQSLCPPGEPVGLLAAQSIGEPSTQMTLNTFHFAGRGDMNVTLGIPRLREILMMASKNIKTPSMEIPFLNVSDVEAKAQVLKTKLTRVVVADILEDIRVSVRLELLPRRQQHYTLRFNFLPKECCKDYYAPIGLVLKHMKSSFFHDMFLAIDKMSKIKSRLITYEEQKAKSARARTNDDDDIGETTNQQRDENSSDDEVEDEDDAKMSHKQREANEDQDPDDDDEKRDAESGDEDVANADDSQAQEKNKEKQDDYVLGKYIFANKYSQNKKGRWCELSFALPLRYKRCDLTNLLKDVAAKSVLWQTPHIKRAITYVKDGALTLRTDGINIVEMFKYHDLLDLNKLYCNDIHKMAETYGIEAASKILVKEVKDVFNVYGIKVDARHLSLIADYMTFTGHYEPMSRKGIEKSASPLQQMSFESSLAFLKEAIIKAKQDDLSNPSSSLIIGKPCEIGTGSFHLLSTLPK
ncbi:DNA-directed RNA polymerase I subunit RPA1 isoform X2 [Cylas formicarius]|nr:DNA-directed RNA polymerase I subunit RPA1 isoform X2 [Cylas formicarius]